MRQYSLGSGGVDEQCEGNTSYYLHEYFIGDTLWHDAERGEAEREGDAKRAAQT